MKILETIFCFICLKLAFDTPAVLAGSVSPNGEKLFIQCNLGSPFSPEIEPIKSISFVKLGAIDRNGFQSYRVTVISITADQLNQYHNYISADFTWFPSSEPFRLSWSLDQHLWVSHWKEVNDTNSPMIRYSGHGSVAIGEHAASVACYRYD